MNFIFLFLVLGIVSIFVVTVYGYLGALVSYKLGDDSAEVKFRLTMDPRKHIDKVGLIMMILFQTGFVKFMKNDESKFENKGRDLFLVVIIPGIIITFASFLMFCIVMWYSTNVSYHSFVYLITYYIYVSAVGISLYNIIPITPLACSKIFNAFANPYVKERMKQRRILITVFLAIITFFIVGFGIFFNIAEWPIDIIFG